MEEIKLTTPEFYKQFIEKYAPKDDHYWYNANIDMLVENINIMKHSEICTSIEGADKLVEMLLSLKKPELTEISGSRLTQLLWERNGSTYTRGPETIIYDGEKWMWKGKQVQYLEDLPTALTTFAHLSLPNLPKP